MNRLGGAILNFLYNEIITHIPCHFIRKNFLCLFNKRIDRTVKILMHTRLLNFWKLEIGPHCVINQYVLLDCRVYQILLEGCVDIGPYTKIWTLGHDPDSDTHALSGGNVLIQSHVWIASGVTVLPKLTIGRGAVIASSSVVSKSVDELNVVAGNPAKFIRKRINSLNYTLSYIPLLD